MNSAADWSPRRHLAAMNPEQAAGAWADGRPAVWALGAIEWHGPSLPLGLDQIVAEHFAAQLAEAANGVLLPPLCAPITTLPHPMSLDVPELAAIEAWEATLDGLARQGCPAILVVTGHYAQGHMIELAGACLRAMDAHPAFCAAPGTPLELLDDPNLLDHAGRWEASQLLAIAPPLVGSFEGFPQGSPDPKEFAVLGESPALASAKEGQDVLARGLAAWTALSRAIRAEGQAPARARCLAMAESCRSYEQAWHRHSWQQAITDWWAAKISSSPSQEG